MRNKRVVIYGGTQLNQALSKFVSLLAYELLKNERIMLVTGGFTAAGNQPSDKIPTDVAVLNGAELFAKEHGVPLDTILEAWLPEPAKDRREEGVERFPGGKVIPGLSAQARRLRLVQMADAIVTVMGEVRTALVLEMALAIARPALPLPFTKGDSEDHWRENRSYYMARLGITEDQAQRWEGFSVDEATAEAKAACLAEIVTAVNGVIRRNCLVLMPFKEELRDLYSSLKQRIDAEGFHPVRLDRDLYAGDVRETVRRLLRESDAIIADVTDRSANVMYEVGLAHAFGRDPLLLWRGDAKSLESQLPFYLRPQRIVFGTDPAQINEALKAYLDGVRSGRDHS